MTVRRATRRIATALGAGAAVFALSLGGAGLASADPPFTCKNGGGNTPQSGQCQGGGLDVVNPGGNAPGGHNK